MRGPRHRGHRRAGGGTNARATRHADPRHVSGSGFAKLNELRLLGKSGSPAFTEWDPLWLNASPG